MSTTRLRATPKYFIAAFGEKYASAHPVHGGEYPLGRLSNRYSYIMKGDVMLLYCTGSYVGHYMEAPAVGVIVDTETSAKEYTLHYRYLQLSEPVPRDTINSSIGAVEKDYFINPGANFIFEIASTSFQATLKGRYINWP